MPIKASISYKLSQDGQRDSLRKGGNGRPTQIQVGDIESLDVDAFVVDEHGQAQFDATLAPESLSSDKYFHIGNAQSSPWGSRVKIAWNIVPSWNDLLEFVRSVHESDSATALEMAADYDIYEKDMADAGRTFLADPSARATSVEDYLVSIDGFQFSDPAIVEEAQRRRALDQDARRMANRETLRIWIIDHGTANQRERLLADLLPWKEAQEALEQHLFAPLEKFPPYERFKPEHVCICGVWEQFDPLSRELCKIHFQSIDATELTASEWESYRSIAAVVPDAKFQLREHRAKCASRPEVLVRRGVIVKRSVGSLTFKREYALGGADDLS